MTDERGRHTARSYGELYTYENSLAITLTTAGTYYVLTGLTAHISEGVVMSPANATHTLEDGIYKIECNVSFSGNKVSTIHCSLHLDDVHQDSAAFERKIGSPNDIGNATLGGVVDVVGGTVADLRFKSDTNATELDITHLQFIATRYY